MTGPFLAAIAAVALGQAAAPVTAPGGATATPVAGAPAPAVARRVEGRVTFATATTAYLDAGSAEGVAPGQVIRLTRAGQPSGTCTVRETADHSATCLGPGLKAGDRFAVDTTVPGAPLAAKLAPVPTDEELAGRNAAVAATPVVLVESKAQPRDIVIGTLPSLRGDLGYALWLGSPGGPGDSQRIQLDIQLNGIDTFAGFKLYGDARFLQWTQKDSTYVPGSNTSLLVYDLELAQRDPKRNWTAAFGRVSPWFVPGATLFDGAQGGLKFGRTEVGVFGGLVPDTWTTAPTVSQYTGGAYVRFEVPIEGTLLSGGARAAVVRNDAVQTHYEGELLLSYWAGKVLSASGNLRMGFGDVQAPASIDSARIVATVRPADIAWITAGFSYWGLTVPDGEPIATYPGPARRADAS
ncbi:MAG TPA: hypothetical protein VFM45_03795, partial [Anaeromyxobacteraceae bacterium]|nr:hypothetical protein [Anaeromyxobacteraceae bacterium]